MTIGIYNPYFDALGGGERYCLALASHWSEKHHVHIFWDDRKIIQKAEDRFNIDLSKVKVAQNFFKSKNILKKIVLSRKYNLIFFLSDGSIPISFATRNILHFQVPFKKLLVSRLKLQRFQAIICNSEFTRIHLDQQLSDRAIVIYPPVDTYTYEPVAKEKFILSVGRFSGYFQAKKQEVLIDAFTSAYHSGIFDDWKLILAGGLLESDHDYFRSLERRITHQPIELMPNISHKELQALYVRSSVYWHAAGYGETDPEHMEHFGMTTVEAMAAGSIPVVFAGGGQTEIIRDGIDGFLWKTPQELIEKTDQITKNSKLQERMRHDIPKRARLFSQERFFAAFDDLISKITA